ncbi:MAG TPA: hypothetical protein VN442_19700 [Bryobacteraceae bacterium]|nr:hypothetical protein [Bryobacteraceae bacterium]
MIVFRAVGVLVSSLALSFSYGAPPAERQEGNILYLSIPPDVSTSDVEFAGPRVARRLDEHVRARFSKRRVAGAVPSNTPAPDLIIVLLDHEGQPIVPERKGVKANSAAAATPSLSFTYDSPASPWTPDELATLQSLVKDMYPIVEQIYGTPAFTNQVNIRRDPYLSASGTYNLSVNEIVVGSLRPDVVCHEMVHAFRDDNLIRLNSFEEGMARAVEVEVFNRLPALYHWDRGHGYSHDVFYDALNRPEMGGAGGNFAWGFVNLLLRYQLSGYAWGKVLIENPRFLPRFNAALYTAAQSNPAVTGDEAALLDIAARFQGSVEGTAFRDWYGSQGILNSNPPAGQFLDQFIFRAPDDITFYLFERNSWGGEWMLSSVPLSATFYDHAGQLVGSGSGVTGAYGWTSIPAWCQGYSGRMGITATAPLPDGGTATISSHAFAGTPAGIFGLVTNADNGTITITPANSRRSAVTVPVVNGVFAAPELESFRGTFTATLDPLNGKRYTRTFTKDASPYFLYLDPR